jgi:hypothetical protein
MEIAVRRLQAHARTVAGQTHHRRAELDGYTEHCRKRTAALLTT